MDPEGPFLGWDRVRLHRESPHLIVSVQGSCCSRWDLPHVLWTMKRATRDREEATVDKMGPLRVRMGSKIADPLGGLPPPIPRGGG